MLRWDGSEESSQTGFNVVNFGVLRSGLRSEKEAACDAQSTHDCEAGYHVGLCFGLFYVELEAGGSRLAEAAFQALDGKRTPPPSDD